MMNELFFNRMLRSAAIMGMLGVAVGAFGAHFLWSGWIQDLSTYYGQELCICSFTPLL